MVFEFSGCIVVACVYWSNSAWNRTAEGGNGTNFVPVEIDNCGPIDVLTPGKAVWLLLVPVVACAVHLPGSMFLLNRSTWYRLSPEFGIADTLATMLFLVKALWRGHGWKNSVLAMLLMRDGIGRGDMWWRDRVGGAESQETTGTIPINAI